MAAASLPLYGVRSGQRFTQCASPAGLPTRDFQRLFEGESPFSPMIVLFQLISQFLPVEGRLDHWKDLVKVIRMQPSITRRTRHLAVVEVVDNPQLILIAHWHVHRLMVRLGGVIIGEVVRSSIVAS